MLRTVGGIEWGMRDECVTVSDASADREQFNQRGPTPGEHRAWMSHLVSRSIAAS